MKTLRFLCPNGHLGFAPIKTGSFNLGVETKPDFILADSGSDDIGPGPLRIGYLRQPAGLAAPRPGTHASGFPQTGGSHDHRLGRRYRDQ